MWQEVVVAYFKTPSGIFHDELQTTEPSHDRQWLGRYFKPAPADNEAHC
jgi:hypothetical protein